ncbi:HpcH/HpaI aldolase/citrate lyase family protein [Clostridium sp.]|uniref:HpcH/HpaI aldolase/citrate lyase family protein n=1 Tax=Clostridium sp. TaxID=1506 RepID=UPI0039F55F51
MKFFSDLPVKEISRIFYKEPSYIRKSSPKEYLSLALGATLYMPAFKEGILDIILNNKYKRLTSMVLCLEDSVPEERVEEAEKNLIDVLSKLTHCIEENKCIKGNKSIEENMPLIFVRVRNVEQFKRISENRKNFYPLTGFNFPKFDSTNGEEYLKILKDINKDMSYNLYAMPILESKNIIYKESRLEELIKVKKILDAYKSNVLNIRIGGTDFLGLYAIRRQVDNSIYDIGVVKDCIADIVNMFGRAEEEYTISGPVWEYFNTNPDNRIFKPQLRQSPFVEHLGESGLKKRDYYVEKCIDGLIKEVVLDKANGLIGKTIIHPSHISIVNALYVVTKEEYDDARFIIESNKGGAYKSRYNNKMNEVNPHLNWANKILRRAHVYGVFNEDKSYVDLL